MKKRIYIISIALALTGQLLFSQTFSIQGVLKNQYGKTLVDGYYQVTFRLYNVAAGGIALWIETHPDLVTNNGMFVAELGSFAAFADLQFNRDYWLGIKVGNTAEMSPRMKLSRVPYSFTASGANNIFPSSGNAGIGTKEPENLMEVSSNDETFVSVSSANGDAGFVFDNNQNSEWQLKCRTNDNAMLITKSGFGDVFMIQPGGNVGIGTDNPQSELHIGGAGGENVDLAVNGQIRSGGNSGGFQIGTDRFIGGFETDKLGIKSSDDWRLTVLADGKIGIGTTEPTEALEIAGNLKLSSDGALVFADSTSLSSAKITEPAEAVSNTASVLMNADADGDSIGGLNFYTGNQKRLTLSNNGKVGIGTSVTQNTLEVAGEVNFSGSMTKSGIPVSTSEWIVNSGDRYYYYPYGNVGIKKQNPVYDLDVQGTVNVNELHINGSEYTFTNWSAPDPSYPNDIMNTIGGGVYIGLYFNDPDSRFHQTPRSDAALQTNNIRTPEWYICGSIGGSANNNANLSMGKSDNSRNAWKSATIYWLNRQYVHTLSDRRVKQNIQPVTNALDKVIALRGYRYKADEEPPALNDKAVVHPEYELDFDVAELGKIMPGMVSYDEETGYYLIENYDQLFPFLTEAIKELNAKNEYLETRLASINARIEKIKGAK